MSDWKTDLRRGEAAEAELDKFYSLEFHIRPARREEQAMGIDRFFRRWVQHWNRAEFPEALGLWFSIEYKTDFAASRTGNVFIELQQRRGRDAAPHPGWALKLMAQYLLFFIPPRRVIWVPTHALKERLQEWCESCDWSNWVEDRNGYAARGLLVPLPIFSEMRSRQDVIYSDADSEKTIADVRKRQRAGSSSSI